jgi:hypothetical protein
MKKPSIPATGNLPPEIARVIEPIKTNVELITGARPGSVSLQALDSAATLADAVTKINQILSRINQSG